MQHAEPLFLIKFVTTATWFLYTHGNMCGAQQYRASHDDFTFSQDTKHDSSHCCIASVGLALAESDTGKGEKGLSRWRSTEVLRNARLLRQLPAERKG